MSHLAKGNHRRLPGQGGLLEQEDSEANPQVDIPEVLELETQMENHTTSITCTRCPLAIQARTHPSCWSAGFAGGSLFAHM